MVFIRSIELELFSTTKLHELKTEALGLSEMVQLGYPFIRGNTNLSLSISVGVLPVVP